MFKTFSWAIALVLLCSSVNAQKKELTLQDAVIGQYTKFRPKAPTQLQWIKNSNTLSWVNKDTNNPAIVGKNYPDGQEQTLLTLNELKEIEGFEGLKRFPRFSWLSEKKIKIQNGRSFYELDIEAKSAVKLYSIPKGGANFDINPQNSMAFTRGQNLFVLDGENETQVTSDSAQGIVNGQSVHRYEFGISKGTFWSTSGKMLAFYRKDESMVTEYPLANYGEKPAAPSPVRYPMAGMASHHVTIGVYNLVSKTTVWLKTGEPAEQYLTNVAWSPDDKFIYVAIVNRDQNHVKFNQYDSKTGDFVQTLFEEKDEKYVQPLHAMVFLPGKKDEFIWQSERDGYDHLYVYNTKGKLLRQLTKGEWVISSLHGFDSDGKLIVTRTDNRGMDRVIYKVDVKTGEMTPWITKSGSHQIVVSDDGMMVIDKFSSISEAYVLSVINSKGKVEEEIMKVENPVEDYQVRLPELGSITTNEGVVLNTRMFKPFDFDPSKKYKALVYVYNGPNAQLITNRWMGGAPMWMAFMANHGYIVYTVDGRGSENRGKDFEQIIFRQVGEYEMVDQLSGVEYLWSLDYVNKEKMAIHGWSYGGFMTTSLMLKAPGIFKVGVAGGPVMDWKYYEVMYTERYMDTPETNPAGFAKASLLDKVENLKGDLLLIHGADDDVVVPQHSIDFIKHAVDKGVQIDFFLYPGHKHNVRGKDRVHLMQKVLDYIDEKLQ